MAFFSKILEKLGFGSSATAPTATPPPTAAEGPAAGPSATPPPQPVAVILSRRR